MLLVVDNGSVYTQSLLDAIREIKVEFTNASFDKVIGLDLNNYSSIILSGRRKNDPVMNAINSKLIRHAIAKEKPLLGICYGAEILALTVGGTIKKMSSERNGIYKIDIINDNPLCMDEVNVFESHSYTVAKLDSVFQQIAKSSACEFEIFQYDKKNIFGTQFHPEMSQDGKSLLKKFVSF